MGPTRCLPPTCGRRWGTSTSCHDLHHTFDMRTSCALAAHFFVCFHTSTLSTLGCLPLSGYVCRRYVESSQNHQGKAMRRPWRLLSRQAPLLWPKGSVGLHSKHHGSVSMVCFSIALLVLRILVESWPQGSMVPPTPGHDILKLLEGDYMAYTKAEVYRAEAAAFEDPKSKLFEPWNVSQADMADAIHHAQQYESGEYACGGCAMQ